ncbi:adenylosuccinate lyase [Gammaproteobacteria bacterium]|nr:adenylosuccinate lyase [Gammaproteobacteria bacterium]
MKIDTLKALSPLDGRYSHANTHLRDILSEYGLIKYRIRVEIEWFIHLSKQKSIPELPTLSIKDNKYLTDLIHNFSEKDAVEIKKIEKKTNHDVKAVEYYLKDKFSKSAKLTKYLEFIHFACTSEDINNLAYSLMIRDSSNHLLKNNVTNIERQLRKKARSYASVSMLSRTHGQSATPTTMGKELANTLSRLKKIRESIESIKLSGKINGAVGNYNAHLVAYPNADWLKISNKFVLSLGLAWNPYTTQVEPKDDIAELFLNYVRLNNVFIDFSRDVWGYISLGYFSQNLKKGEVGSSTMPHKVNPIDFENAEGNLGISNALLTHISSTVVISRWQRDLSDSTVMRNISGCFGHTTIALKSLEKGIDKLQINKIKIKEDLDTSWEVLTEAIQTVLRKHLIPNGYELMKDLSRGKVVNKKALMNLIDELAITEEDKIILRQLSPSTYIGMAKKLAKDI